jgi:type IV pilus assembly protein PilW
MLRRFKSANPSAGQRGFSLIELSIAILIALFLLGGLVTLLMGTRRTNATQSSLSQLQDNERIAMTLITNIVQKAGYFSNPVLQDLDTFAAENISGVSMAQGEVLGGLYNAAAPGDTLAVRFYTPASDPFNSVIDCAGQSNTAASSAPVSTLWYTNVFRIRTVNATQWLTCETRSSGAGLRQQINLIPNVTQIAVLYGVSSSAAGDDYSIVQYLNASQVTATTNWKNVTAVKVTLTFQVPDYGTTGGQMLPSSAPNSTTTITRVIPVMSRAGVNT